MWHQGYADAWPGGMSVLDEGSKATECHPGHDHEADVDVDVEHWGDSMQD